MAFIYIYIYIYTHTHTSSYTRMSQKFCNILSTYFVYSSIYNKSSLTFQVEANVLHSLKHVSSLISQWYKFLIFKVKNSLIKDSASSSLLKYHKCRK